MKKENILKTAVVLLITTVMILSTVSVTANTKTFIPKPSVQVKSITNSMNRDVLFEDDFESYDDFVLDFPPWTQYDGDGFGTWGFEDNDFENEHYIGAFIIFVPDMCEPPLVDPPHSGEKYAACFDGEPVEPQNDWMITPQLTTAGGTDFYVGINCVDNDAFWLGIDDFSVSEVDDTATITFWAKTGTSQYEPDRFRVGVSLTDNDPESFFIVTEEPYIEPPTSCTEYTYEVELVSPEEPELEVTVSGGFGVTASVSNVGNADATNCEVTFTFEGGLIILPSGGTSTVTIDTIAAGASEDAKVTVFGIGKPVITVDVTCDEGAEASATYEPSFVFLFFVLG